MNGWLCKTVSATKLYLTLQLVRNLCASLIERCQTPLRNFLQWLALAVERIFRFLICTNIVECIALGNGLSFLNETKEIFAHYLVSIFTSVASGVHTIPMNFRSRNGTNVAPSIFIPTMSRVLGSNVFFRNVKWQIRLTQLYSIHEL